MVSTSLLLTLITMGLIVQMLHYFEVKYPQLIYHECFYPFITREACHFCSCHAKSMNETQVVALFSSAVLRGSLWLLCFTNNDAVTSVLHCCALHLHLEN